MPITHVQSITGGWGGSSSALTLTFNSAVTSGNLIVVSVSLYSNSTVTVSDNQGNTYTMIGSYYSGGSGQAVQFYAENVTGGTVTLTITPNQSAYFGVTATEYAGALTSGSLDSNGSTTVPGTGALGLATSASIHTTQGGVMVACVSQLGGEPISAVDGNIRGFWAVSQSIIAFDKFNAASGSDTTSVLANLSGFGPVVVVASFKPVSPGGGGGGGGSSPKSVYIGKRRYIA